MFEGDPRFKIKIRSAQKVVIPGKGVWAYLQAGDVSFVIRQQRRN